MNKDTNSSSLVPITNLPIISQGSLEEYIRFVNSIPLLTEEEELQLANKWHKDEDIEAARYLVLSHLRLVVSIARNYAGYGLSLADLIQEGTIGLMKAIKRFDPSRNVRLVTFAMHWIKAEINEFVVRNWRIVKTVTTKNQRKLFFNLRSNRLDIGNLSEEEAVKIADKLSVSRDDVVEMNMRLTGRDVALIGEDSEDYAPGDWLEDESTTPEFKLQQKLQNKLYSEGLEKALNELDARSRDIICSHWLVDPDEKKTLAELAKKYNVSAERIRQIEQQAMQKMKKLLSNYKEE